MEMRKVFLIFLSFAVFMVVANCIDFTEEDLTTDESLWDLYERWRSHHTVSRDLGEKRKRFNVFKYNVQYIHKVNQMDKPYKLKLNKFADMTNHEFKTGFDSKIQHFRALKGERRTTPFRHEKTTDPPPSIDWRQYGAVNPVKNQGRCGSCWAFSTIVGVEGINKIKTNTLVSLSEQELVDCNSDNHGCEGGFMEDAYEYIKETGGVTTEQIYPYFARNGLCDISKRNSPVVKIDGFENVPKNDETALLKAVANQPVSIAIDAGGLNFQFYSEGVFNGICGTELNHGVAIVGYGTTQEGTNYWIVRNSWGSGWGEQGYIRMLRGFSEPEGLCGLAMECSYPIKVSSDNPKSVSKDEL
ncbi:vignain [Lactuca sativa]|uniref:Cysteine proteinase n=1 Tax=Lactuca sativa TaxID=4236 RepID=A0A9R1W2W4_LACSA|nr:vignain [Lactuca sativa]KAJ0217396.1 hypothetical protein LSAT_V11C300112990 [Lactuca sativa]